MKKLLIPIIFLIGTSTIFSVYLMNQERDLSTFEGYFLLGYILFTLLLILITIVTVLVGAVKVAKNLKIISRQAKKRAIIFLGGYIPSLLIINIFFTPQNLNIYYFIGLPLFALLLFFAIEAIVANRNANSGRG
ncbi:hypothetical protein [Bacillus alkalisoli]|uniref:hypothetical protein n=1 Tax=Bacillus alkalisoli TaxID=2011008 RepID=UPI000C24A00D|nr:hypothetical protein [Bacillus alkalisoli]